MVGLLRASTAWGPWDITIEAKVGGDVRFSERRLASVKGLDGLVASGHLDIGHGLRGGGTFDTRLRLVA